jgi:hypothetical protein
MVRHVYAEGPIVPGVGMSDIVKPLMETHAYPSIKIQFRHGMGLVQVWFDAEDVTSKQLQDFSVGGFRFDYLDVY